MGLTQTQRDKLTIGTSYKFIWNGSCYSGILKGYDPKGQVLKFHLTSNISGKKNRDRDIPAKEITNFGKGVTCQL
jgi:hypothetical protein